jgi:hypothetical protein
MSPNPRARDAAGVDLVADYHVEPELGRRPGKRARESRVEQNAGVVHRDEGMFLRRDGADVGEGVFAAIPDMGVPLDEARHQRGAGGIDLRRPVPGQPLVSRGDGDDAVALDANLAGKRRPPRSVPDGGASEDDRGHQYPSTMNISLSLDFWRIGMIA